MSTIRVANVHFESTGTNRIDYLDDNKIRITSVNTVLSGDMSVAGTMAMGSSFLRNRIINGDMRIDQRNGGTSLTPVNGQYSIDRWFGNLTAASKFSIQQNAGSVTPPAGFSNYLGVTSLSAYSVLTGDIFGITQIIEGVNTSDLAWGSANAQSVTISFLVRSSLTGTFGGALRNNDNSRSYPFTYTISSANTWEIKTVTVTGDTSGTWLTTSSGGIKLTFGLGAGATFGGTAGTWASANYLSATGATSVVGTNGATFYITGVQLEAGTVATPFERRLYGQELALCQRYYQQFGGVTTAGQKFYIMGGYYTSGNDVYPQISLPVQMRAAPIGNIVGTWTVSNGNMPTVISTSPVSITFAGRMTANGLFIAEPNSADDVVTLSAEL